MSQCLNGLYILYRVWHPLYSTEEIPHKKKQKTFITGKKKRAFGFSLCPTANVEPITVSSCPSGPLVLVSFREKWFSPHENICRSCCCASIRRVMKMHQSQEDLLYQFTLFSAGAGWLFLSSYLQMYYASFSLSLFLYAILPGQDLISSNAMSGSL